MTRTFLLTKRGFHCLNVSAEWLATNVESTTPKRRPSIVSDECHSSRVATVGSPEGPVDPEWVSTSILEAAPFQDYTACAFLCKLRYVLVRKNGSDY